MAKKRKKTLLKLAVESGDKVKSSKTEKARNEGFIVGQSVLVADQELD